MISSSPPHFAHLGIWGAAKLTFLMILLALLIGYFIACSTRSSPAKSDVPRFYNVSTAALNVPAGTLLRYETFKLPSFYRAKACVSFT